MPSKRSVPDARVKKLKAMCGLGIPRCRKALETHGGDVEKALAALIDAGEVTTKELDPETVSDELFARAAQRQQRQMLDKLKRRSGSLFKWFPDELRDAMKDELTRVADEGKNLEVSGAAERSMARITRRNEALKKKPVVVKLPPLPPLTLSLGYWLGQDVLKAWAGFGPRRGSKGKVGINIQRAPDDDDAKPVRPPPEMVAAYRHLKEHEAEVRDALLDAFRSEVNERFEPVADAKALKKMMTLDSVRPMSIAKDGLAYVGLFFHCTWDPEHDAGAVVHGSRVVAVGDNEAAGDVIAVFRDGGREIRGWESGLAEYVARNGEA